MAVGTYDNNHPKTSHCDNAHHHHQHHHNTHSCEGEIETWERKVDFDIFLTAAVCVTSQQSFVYVTKSPVWVEKGRRVIGWRHLCSTRLNVPFCGSAALEAVLTDERHLLRVYLRFKFRDFNKRKVYEMQRKSTYQFTQHFFALKLEVLKHLLDVSQSAPKSRRNRLEKTTLLIQILFSSSSHYRVNKTLCFVSPFINHLSISLFIDLERRKKISSVYILFFFVSKGSIIINDL